jgi:hypothetical protein
LRSFFDSGCAQFAKFLESASIDTRALALGLGAKGIRERLYLNDVGALYFDWSDAREGIETEISTSTNLAQVWVRGIVEELHWKFIATQKHRVRIMLLGLQARTEVIQCCL